MPLLNDSNIPLVQIIVTIALGHNTIILLYHTCTSVQKITYLKTLSIISMLLMLILIIYLLPNVYAFWPVSWNCKWIVTVSGLSWMYAKLSIYILFLERLFRVFSNSALQFKPYQIYSSRISISIWTIFMTTIMCIATNAHRNPGPGITTHCLPDVPSFVFGLIALGDILICTCISIVFSRRLLMLNLAIIVDEERQIQNAVMSNKTLELLSKFTLLTFIALCTTQLALLFSGVIGVPPLFMSLDMMVNSLCIMLMFTVHEKVYNFCCGYCKFLVTMKCLYGCSCACCWTIKDDQHICKENISNKMDRVDANSVHIEDKNVVTMDV